MPPKQDKVTRPDSNMTKTMCLSHWEELLQSVSEFIFSKHCGCRSRGLRGVNRSEKLWEIQNYPLPGRPFTHHSVKSNTICHFSRDFDTFLNGFWFYSNTAWWSTWQWVFVVFWHPWHITGCASTVTWNHCLKLIWVISPTLNSCRIT